MCAACAVTWGSVLGKSLHLVSYSAITIIKFRIILEQRACIFILLGALHIMWLVSHPVDSLTSHFAQVFVEASSASETCLVSICPSSFEATLLSGSQVGLFLLRLFPTDSFFLSASLTCPLPASSLQPTHRLIIIFQKQIKKKKHFLAYLPTAHTLASLHDPRKSLLSLSLSRSLVFASPPSAPCSPCRSSSQTVHAPDQGPFPSSPRLPSEASPLSGLPAPVLGLSSCRSVLSSFLLSLFSISRCGKTQGGLFQSSL